jgi:hypothetical protein
MTPDGRFVAFQVNGGGLVRGDTNGVGDIYVRDRREQATTRVSLSSTGGQGKKASTVAAISATGRFVVFDSIASNLVPGDTNRVSDVFVHDRWSRSTTRVSLSATGSQGNAASALPTLSAAITADGRRAAFASDATNLVPNDTNALGDIFLRHLRR